MSKNQNVSQPVHVSEPASTQPEVTDAAAQPIRAVQLARGTRLSWAPNKVIDNEVIHASPTLTIEASWSFPGIVLTNTETQDGRCPVTRVPWSGVVAVHG